MFFDDDNLYVSARNYESVPESDWVANEMRRDTSQLRTNDSFSVMTYATRVGEFDTITGLSIGDGRALIPVYDATACAATDCTGKGPYPILGFAAFRVTGYSLNGNNFAGTLGKKCPDATRGRYCLQGDFIRFTTTNGSPGGGGDYGVTQVYLSK